MLPSQALTQASNASPDGGAPSINPKHFYKTKLCKDFMSGMCMRGVACSFAHNNNELRPLPVLYKTRMCLDYMRGCCTIRSCRFAHSNAELNTVGESNANSAQMYQQQQQHHQVVMQQQMQFQQMMMAPAPFMFHTSATPTAHNFPLYAHHPGMAFPQPIPTLQQQMQMHQSHSAPAYFTSAPPSLPSMPSLPSLPQQHYEKVGLPQSISTMSMGTTTTPPLPQSHTLPSVLSKTTNVSGSTAQPPQHQQQHQLQHSQQQYSVGYAPNPFQQLNMQREDSNNSNHSFHYTSQQPQPQNHINSPARYNNQQM